MATNTTAKVKQLLALALTFCRLIQSMKPISGCKCHLLISLQRLTEEAADPIFAVFDGNLNQTRGLRYRPSSCTRVWPGVTYFEPSITVGPSCAVLQTDNIPNSWDFAFSCASGDSGCSTLSSLCSTQFETELSHFLTTGRKNTTTSFYGYHETGGVYIPSWITAASYDPSWKYTGTSPCCGSCSIDGGTVEVYVWPATDDSNRSTATVAPLNSNQSAHFPLHQNHSIAGTLVSDGFTLYVGPNVPFC